MTKDEALRFALEALETCDGGTSWADLYQKFNEKLVGKAITAIKEALAQPAQPPYSVQQAYAMAQVCLDLHDALGCKWGDNVYLTISQLKAAHGIKENT